MSRAWLVDELARRLEEPAADVAAQLDRMVDAGLLDARHDRGDAGRVTATSEGTALFARARSLVDEIASTLVGPVDATDLETTIRVLRGVSERAQVLARA